MKDILDPSAPKPAPSGEKTVRVRVEPVVRNDGARNQPIRNAVVQSDVVRPDGAGAAAAEAPAADADGFASNRKLIRPSLASRPDRNAPDRNAGERLGADRAMTSLSKKPAPPEQTYAEPFYFQKQMQTRTPMVVVLMDGEELRGTVEWYDKDCIKLNRTGPQPNLLVYKAHIKYVFKDEGKR